MSVIRRETSELSDDELSQESFNCAAILRTELEETEPSLELVALVLLRLGDCIEELGGEDLEKLAKKASQSDLDAFAATAVQLGDGVEDV